MRIDLLHRIRTKWFCSSKKIRRSSGSYSLRLFDREEKNKTALPWRFETTRRITRTNSKTIMIHFRGGIIQFDRRILTEEKKSVDVTFTLDWKETNEKIFASMILFVFTADLSHLTWAVLHRSRWWTPLRQQKLYLSIEDFLLLTNI